MPQFGERQHAGGEAEDGRDEGPMWRGLSMKGHQLVVEA
jgi:hypothetical protein